MSGLTTLLESRSHNTALFNKDLWSANASFNKSRIKNQISSLWMDKNDKSGVLIAAGPSLKQSIPEIKALNRSLNEIVCVDMALNFLLQNGVAPDYVLCADSSKDISSTLVKSPKEVSLILNVIVDSNTAKDWAGDIYWFCMMSNYYDREAGDFMQFDHQKKSGVSSFLVPGGNVSSLGVSFLSGIRACREILLYGHDFCWENDDEFYAGGVRSDLAGQRISSESESGTVLDVSASCGRRVKTTGSLMSFRDWYQETDRMIPGLLVQRTPTTILEIGGNKNESARI